MIYNDNFVLSGGGHPALVFRGFTLRRPAAVFVVSAVLLLAWVIARLDDPQPGGDGPAQRRQAGLVGRFSSTTSLVLTL